MIFPIGATRRTQHETASQTVYDAVVVGGGISGSIIADELSRAGKRVLVLEAGIGEDHSLRGLRGLPRALLRHRVQGQPVAVPGQPRTRRCRASSEAHRIWPGSPDTSGYLVQNGPFATDTTYTRVLGGTTMHWEAKTPRMLPEDFDLRTPLRRRARLAAQLRGADAVLRPGRARARRRRARWRTRPSSASHFEPDYVYPMHEMPPSYLDQVVAKGIDGTYVELGRRAVSSCRSGPSRRPATASRTRRTTAARAIVPTGRREHQPGRRGRPVPGQHQLRARSARCRPSTTPPRPCPRHWRPATSTCWPRPSASGSSVDPQTGRVTGIECKAYADPDSPRHSTWTVRGRIFVLARQRDRERPADARLRACPAPADWSDAT